MHVLRLRFPGGLVVKNPPTIAAVQSLGGEDSLEEEMAAHSSILAWKIPCTEEPGGLQSTGSQRVQHNWARSTTTHILWLRTGNITSLHKPVNAGLWLGIHWQSDHWTRKAMQSTKPLRQCSQARYFVYGSYTFQQVKVKSPSRVRLFATPWTVAYEAPPSMGFSRQEYWSGCHFLLQGIFPTQGSNPGLPHCMQTVYRLSHQEVPLPNK